MHVRRYLGLIALGVCAGCSSGNAAEPAVAEVGAPVPAYAALDLAGDSVSLASLRGRVVLLNVWATWCPPCREEMPDLQAIQRELEPAGLSVVAVSIDGDGDAPAIREFLDRAGVRFTVLHDPSEEISRVFRTTGVPETFLIDRDGVLRRRWIGQISRDGVRRAVLDLMGPTAS